MRAHTEARLLPRWTPGLLVVLLLAAALGCTRTVVVQSGPPCPGGVWLAGHYGPLGAWHAGHWRCPGVVEVVETD
jgi:hypothetical protein